MKKATILIISVVYVASIVLVGLFGLNALLVNDTIYIDSIVLPDEILGKEVKTNGEDKYVTLRYETNAKDSDGRDCMVVNLSYNALPKNATKRNNINVALESFNMAEEDESYTPVLTKGLMGDWTITFYCTSTATLCFEATDGRNAKAKLRINVLPPKAEE